MEDDDHETAPLHSSGRNRSPISLSCCFHGRRQGRSLDFDASSPSSCIMPDPGSPWTPTKAPGRSRHFMSRKGRNRRNSSADFSYDPMSYALNFEEPSDADEPFRSFTSRLPLSPPRGNGTLTTTSVMSASAPLPSSMSGRTSEQQMSINEAVTEVRKGLQLSAAREEIKRKSHDFPTLPRPR